MVAAGGQPQGCASYGRQLHEGSEQDGDAAWGHATGHPEGCLPQVELDTLKRVYLKSSWTVRVYLLSGWTHWHGQLEEKDGEDPNSGMGCAATVWHRRENRGKVFFFILDLPGGSRVRQHPGEPNSYETSQKKTWELILVTTASFSKRRPTISISTDHCC